MRKTRRNPPVFPLAFDRPQLEPLVTAIPVAVVAIPVHAALEPVVPAFAAAKAFHMGQHGETTLLALVEGLVERVGRIRDLLQRRRRGSHIVGAFAQAGHRILRLLLILRLIHPRVGAIAPQFGEIPHPAPPHPPPPPLPPPYPTAPPH